MGDGGEPGLSRTDIHIETDEGSMGTYVVRPDHDRVAPLVVFLMDAPGKRPLLHRMADRIAAWGFHVMLPNLYYRVTPHFELDFASAASFERMRELMFAMGNNMASRDVGALVAHAVDDPRVDASAIGVVGYCMSGPFALYAAAVHADVVRAAASFYGTRLATDRPDSPHANLQRIVGEIYVACAEHDEYAPPETVDAFEAAMHESGVRGRLERYAGMHHGFAFTDRPQHDPDGERRHWEALADLFARNLRLAPT